MFCNSVYYASVASFAHEQRFFASFLSIYTSYTHWSLVDFVPSRLCVAHSVVVVPIRWLRLYFSWLPTFYGTVYAVLAHQSFYKRQLVGHRD